MPLPLPTTRLGSGTGTGTTAPKTCDALYDAPCTFGYALDALYVDAAAVAMDAPLPTLLIERPAEDRGAPREVTEACVLRGIARAP